MSGQLLKSLMAELAGVYFIIPFYFQGRGTVIIFYSSKLSNCLLYFSCSVINNDILAKTSFLFFFLILQVLQASI